MKGVFEKKGAPKQKFKRNGAPPNETWPMGPYWAQGRVASQASAQLTSSNPGHSSSA